MRDKRQHGGQLEIPVGNEIGFAHNPDGAYELEYGAEKAAEQRSAYVETRRCTCGSPWPDRWGTRYKHRVPCPRAGRRF